MATTVDRRQSTLQQVADALRGAERVTAICHENPDADTLGAAIAVSIMAERLGAATEIVSIDQPAPNFDFLPRIETVRRRPELEPGLAVVCDAATLQRVGRLATEQAEWLGRARLLNVDHHVSSDYFGDLNLVDPSAAATCEVLSRLAVELGIALDSELATPLLAGIVRDTHGFSDASTSSDTLRAAAMLCDAGASLAQVHRSILAEMPYSMMALWGRVLSTLEQDADGEIVYAVLVSQMLEATETQQHDADGVVEFMARANGAAVTLLLRETGAATTRVSIRTDGAVDATQIARAFGGGGHAGRAGCFISEPLSEARRLVLAAARAALAQR